MQEKRYLKKHMRIQICEMLSKYKVRMGIYSFLSLLYSVLVFVVPLVSGNLIDNVLQKKDIKEIITGVCVSFGIVMLSPLTNLLRNRVSVNISLDITKRLRIKMFDRVIDATMEELDKTTKGTIISKFIHDSKEIANFAVNYYVDMIANILLMSHIFCKQL